MPPSTTPPRIRVARASPAELATCLRIRRLVFVEEQSVPPDEELDGRDDACEHLIAYDGDLAVGTARIRWIEHEAEPVAKVERVAVLAQARRLGVGRALMDATEARARAVAVPRVYLHAQEGALAFYRALGYVSHGEPFEDAGIPHRAMSKRI